METTQWSPEYKPMPIAPQPVLQGPLAALLEWQAMAQGAYSANTLRAEGRWRDIPGVLRIRWRGVSAGGPAHRWRIYRFASEGWQEARHNTALCGDDLARAYRRPSTQSLLKRSRPVGIEEDGTRNLRSPGPGASLELEGHQGIIESAGEGLRADRERAMLCVAYETLARRGELVALEVRDIEFHPNGTGQALIQTTDIPFDRHRVRRN